MNKSDFTDAEKAQIQAVIDDKADLDDFDGLYEKLFEYFVDSGDMPYGTAKARTGDPIEWICEHLSWALE